MQPPGVLLLDGGLVTGLPAALGTALSTGVALGVTRSCACGFAYGARASWSTATESSLGSPEHTALTVTQQDLRLRAVGELRHAIGRATLALRLGAGATIIHEIRGRSQTRPGLDELGSRETAAVPASDLEAVIDLPIAGRWGLAVSGGPSVDYVNHGVHSGWIAELGIAWQL